MPKPRITFIVCLLLSFAVGVTINSLATSLLAFQKVFGVSNEILGRIQFLFYIGGGFIVLAGGWLTNRLGEKRAGMIVLGCLSLSSLMVARAPSFSWILASSLLFGFGCNGAYVVYSVIVARQYADRRQSMFSIVSLSETTAAILQPIAFSAWFSHVESRSGGSWLLAPYTGVAAIPLVALLLLSFLWKPSPAAEAASEVKERREGSAREVLLSSGIWFIGFCCFLHGAFQIGFVTWVGPYFAARTGITPAQAALFISVNAGGFVVARALLGWLCTRIKIPDLVLLGLASGMGTIIICLVFLTRSYALALVLTFIQGFFVAGNAPAMSSFVGGRFIRQVALAYALYTGLGQVGSAGGGYIVGFLGDWLGSIQRAAWLIPIASGSLALLAFGWHYLEKRKQPVGIPVT